MGIERGKVIVNDSEIIIKDCYRKILDHSTERKIGILKKLPNGLVKDIWCNYNRQSKNWFEFMYNNPNQPNSYIQRNGRKVAYLDNSKANATSNLGSMKEIWKEFEKVELSKLDLENININEIEDSFWNHYITRYKDKFDRCVGILEKYIDEKRKSLTEEERKKEREHYPFLTDEIWIAGCRDYLEYLIRIKTVRGFIVETIFFNSLVSLVGGEYIESSMEEERRGIDGFLLFENEKWPCCIKPNSYNVIAGVSPIDIRRLVFYRQSGNNLVFEFKTGFDLLETIIRKLIIDEM